MRGENELLVVKLGGGAGVDMQAACADLAQIATQRPLVVVHGVSDMANRLTEQYGYPVQTITSPSGHTSRYTDPRTREIFVEAAEIMNRAVVTGLQAHGIPAESLEALLHAGHAPLEALRSFGGLLAAVHTASARCAHELEPRFANIVMRRLNGAQMFAAPYTGSVPSLPAELVAERDRICADRKLRERVESLAAHYAGDRDALVHGDAKAANVLVQGERPRLIDAEFSHIGDPAFDEASGLWESTH